MPYFGGDAIRVGGGIAMTSRLTVTAKGQVTLRRDVLRHLGVRPGERIVLDLLPSRRVELRAGAGDLGGFFGCLPARGAPVSVAAMNRVIERGWAGIDEDHA